jgi:flagellar assembly protein FliH
MTSSVRVPTGGSEAEQEAANEPAQAPQQVVYQQATPVDQAIIEEAQQRAQQMMQEAQAAANQMLMEYQQQAQSMMEQANQQIQAAAEQVQRQAQEIGFQQGYEQGLQQGGLTAQQQVYEQLVESRDIFIQAIKQRHLMLASAEPDLARLAIKVAEKLVGQELQQNPETIVGIVRLALAGIGDREQVLIRVHPVDYDKVVEHRSSFEKMIEGLKKFDVVADAAIDVGGCAIETNLGNIDARLNTRVSALTAGLEEIVALQEKEIADEVAVMDTGVPDLPPPPTEEGEPYQEEPPPEAEAPEEE